MDLHHLSVAEIASRIGAGEVSAREVVDDCLERIAASDLDVQAWQFLDADHARAQATALDQHRAAGNTTGRLHGVPLAIKDIFDTGDMPTELGSPIYRGRTPRRDAACVARLRAAGAVIMGKAVTTEFAYFHPGKTRNPRDSRRTPGGSSSGSAAAVAAMMVPGAIGSQTNGSVIRPAAFCGVVGFKPTHGLIPRSGALLLSRTLDHVGVFARTIEDAALLAEIMMGHDSGDPDTRPIATPLLASIAGEPPPVPPRLALVRTSAWEHAEPQTQEAFAELAASIGDSVAEVTLPSVTAHVMELHRTIMDVEMARSLHREYDDARDQLSDPLRTLIERGRRHLAVDYRRAIDMIEPINAALDLVFDEYDAILTPAAPGEAPIGLDSTGSPVFCTMWTYLGLPAITIPLLRGESGMPMGVQVVGRRRGDARLLRTARWLAEHLSDRRKPPARRKREKGRS